MSNLIVIQEPESFNTMEIDRYGSGFPRSERTTPYFNTSVFKNIERLGLTLPFNEIITKDMGKSVCPDCGAVYAGTQKYCNLKVRKIPNNDFWSTYTPSEKYHKDARIQLCGGTLKWDLDSKFSQQVDFFDFVDMLSRVVVNDWFDKYKDCIPADKLNEYRIKALLADFIDNRNKVTQSFHQIASKMHNAGVSLTF